MVERDSAYHQGTVWPWLMGPFVEAWVRVRGNTAAAKQEAREKFLEPLLAQMNQGGLGHLPELAESDKPYTRGAAPSKPGPWAKPSAWTRSSLNKFKRFQQNHFHHQDTKAPRKDLFKPVDHAVLSVFVSWW